LFSIDPVFIPHEGLNPAWDYIEIIDEADYSFQKCEKRNSSFAQSVENFGYSFSGLSLQHFFLLECGRTDSQFLNTCTIVIGKNQLHTRNFLCRQRLCEIALGRLSAHSLENRVWSLMQFTI
jgi:hypothetical protein